MGTAVLLMVICAVGDERNTPPPKGIQDHLYKTKTLDYIYKVSIISVPGLQNSNYKI